jgi:hypothetical protein
LMAITSMILVYFLVISGFQIWWGGAAFTVRHLIPILPFFGILFIFIPRKYYKLFIGLGILSFSQMLVASAVSYDFFDKYIRQTLEQGFVSSLSWKSSLYYRELFPRLLHHKLTFAWGKYLFGLKSWYFNFAIPLIMAAVLLTIFYFVSKKEDKTLIAPLPN